MAEQHDVVIAGAGHNGLTVGCYLAKAGFDVCMVERSDMVGGGVISRELTAPGFISDPCSTIHIVAQYSPTLRDDELGLVSKYGLKYLHPEVQMCIHFTDGTTLGIYRSLDATCNSIAKYSQKDAEAYRKFTEWAVAGVNAIVQGFYSPPPPFGLFASMMDSSDEGRDLLRCMMMSVQGVVDEWFEHPKTKIALTRWISEIMVSPKTHGTGVMVFVMLGLAHLPPGAGMPVGGSGRLSQVMEQMIKDAGGTVMLNSPVQEFIIKGNECKGVKLDDGREIMARKMVVADLNIQNVFPHMVGQGDVPPEFTHRVDRLKHSFSAFQQSLALNEAPQFKVDDPDISQSFLTEFAPSDYEEYLRYFDDLEYGVPAHFPLVSVQSVHDPSRAPEGKHTMYLYEYAPFALKDGGPDRWDEIREQYADEVLDFVRPFTTNMGSENVIGRWIQSPKDMVRNNPAFVRGDFGHLGSFLEQFMGNRPLPGWNYATPVDNLMMCGPSTHPGSGCTCGGRAAATAVLEKLGSSIDNAIK